MRSQEDLLHKFQDNGEAECRESSTTGRECAELRGVVWEGVRSSLARTALRARLCEDSHRNKSSIASDQYQIRSPGMIPTFVFKYNFLRQETAPTTPNFRKTKARSGKLRRRRIHCNQEIGRSNDQLWSYCAQQ